MTLKLLSRKAGTRVLEFKPANWKFRNYTNHNSTELDWILQTKEMKKALKERIRINLKKKKKKENKIFLKTPKPSQHKEIRVFAGGTL